MPGRAAKITITERQQELLRDLVQATTAPKHLSQRAQIILLAFQGQRNDAIATHLDLERHQVGLWRRRWARDWSRLTNLECTQPLAKLRHAIANLLSDAPRPGAPDTFRAEQLTAIIAVACENPQLSDRPIDHWTLRELADEVIQRKIVASISVSHLHRLLDSLALKPHRCKYWETTTERDPVVFQQGVERVCATYAEAPMLYQTQGVHTTSVDEKPGIQALERTAPDQHCTPGQSARLEYEYQRHGTQCLTGTFHIVTGLLIYATIGATRNELDFLGHIQATVAQDGQGTWVFVLDNLNTHVSTSLVKWIAQECGITAELGVKGKHGILKSLASRKAFLEDRSHRLRLVYTPKHASWLNQIEMWFSILVRKLLKRLSVKSKEEQREHIENFIKYYNSTMAKPFRWTYTGRPLQV